MKVAILTSAYPYYPGEQFIEDEIGYWANSPFSRVILVPASSEGEPRSIPESINVDLCMSGKGYFEHMRFLICALFSIIFLKELVFLYRSKKLSFYTVCLSLLGVSRTLQFAVRLRKFAKINDGIDLAYCYWNNIQSYAAVLVKKEGLIGKVVTRAHRFDLYEERSPHCYMPLKRQFISDFDLIFALSQEGKNYLEHTYGASTKSIIISPLGVTLPSVVADPSPAGNLHLVSVSFCLPVKRIDKIIDSLALVADFNNNTSIKWTHIGDGPLFMEIRKFADNTLSKKKNIHYEFRGEMSKDHVRQFLLNESVDLFINTSESEGIPVSIMEAMSAGIPAIAPDVGGVSQLVLSECGELLSSNPTVEEIAQKIYALSMIVKNQSIRTNARNQIINNFNASNNYSLFIQNLRDLMEIES